MHSRHENRDCDEHFHGSARNMKDAHRSERQREGMADSKRGHDSNDVKHTVSNALNCCPATSNSTQRSWQQEHQQKQQVVRSFCNVAHAEMEQAQELQTSNPGAKG